MMASKEHVRKFFLIFSWGLYDLANQFFALNIVSLYFVRWLTFEKGAPEIFYSISFGISTFFIAILGLILGTISDQLNRRRPFLVYLTFLSILFTMILGISDNILVALLFFIIANFGCQTATVFYNALMINIAPRNKLGLVSGIGKMLSYSGAVIALYLMKPIVLKSGYQATFFPSGLAFLIFSLPCLIFVKDKNPSRPKISILSFFKKEKAREIFKALKATICCSQVYPGLTDFLKACFFGLCTVNIIILFMSVYASRAFNLSESQITNLIAFSTFFAMFGSIASGYICDRIGAKLSLVFVFILWIICLMLGALVEGAHLYWLVGSLVGIALGATWVISRAMAIQLVPAEKTGEIFGLFNLVGYLSSILGVLFWGLIIIFLSGYGQIGYRIALLSLNFFVVVGLVFLLRIPNQAISAKV